MLEFFQSLLLLYEDRQPVALEKGRSAFHEKIQPVKFPMQGTHPKMLIVKEHQQLENYWLTL